MHSNMGKGVESAVDEPKRGIRKQHFRSDFGNNPPSGGYTTDLDTMQRARAEHFANEIESVAYDPTDDEETMLYSRNYNPHRGHGQDENPQIAPYTQGRIYTAAKEISDRGDNLKHQQFYRGSAHYREETRAADGATEFASEVQEAADLSEAQAQALTPEYFSLPPTPQMLGVMQQTGRRLGELQAIVDASEVDEEDVQVLTAAVGVARGKQPMPRTPDKTLPEQGPSWVARFPPPEAAGAQEVEWLFEAPGDVTSPPEASRSAGGVAGRPSARETPAYMAAVDSGLVTGKQPRSGQTFRNNEPFRGGQLHSTPGRTPTGSLFGSNRDLVPVAGSGNLFARVASAIGSLAGSPSFAGSPSGGNGVARINGAEQLQTNGADRPQPRAQRVTRAAMQGQPLPYAQRQMRGNA